MDGNPEKTERALNRPTDSALMTTCADDCARFVLKENMLFIDASLKRTPNETSTLAIINCEVFKAGKF